MLLLVKSECGEGISILPVELLLLLFRRLYGLSRLPNLSSASLLTAIPVAVKAIALATLITAPTVEVPFVVPAVLLTSASTASLALTRPLWSEFRDPLTNLLLAHVVIDVYAVLDIVLGPVKFHSLDLVEFFLDTFVELGYFSFQLLKLLSLYQGLVPQESSLVLQDLDLPFDLQSIS